MKKKVFQGVMFTLYTLASFVTSTGCRQELIAKSIENAITKPQDPLVVTGTSSQSHLPNPERGFRYEAMAKIPSLTFPWDSTRKLNINTWLTDQESVYAATDQHIRVSQLYLYLTDFANTDILSPAALDTIAAVLDGVRAQGYKLVLRFAYTYDGAGGYVYPPMSRILLHLDQLAPVLQSHADVIHVLQAGIIGLWGEWHNYNNAYTATDKTNLLKKILAILPQGRNTQVRLPDYKNTASLSAAEKARVGYHNDFFTDDQHIHANDWGFLSTSVYNQVAAESKYVLVDGEMPYEGSNNSDYLNYALDPIKSIRQLRDHHYSTLSVAHNYPITIANWKSNTITQAQMNANGFPYDPAYFNGGSRSVYDYIADHLGYRLWLDYNASSIVEDDTQIRCNIAIRNYGFSAIQNPREVFLVLFKSDGTLADSIKLNNKPSDWHTGITQTLSATFQKPANTDNYKIGIWMPDYQGSAARLDARYAIRYCNLDWFNYNVSNGAMGINLLNRDSLNSYCAAPGDTDPADRFIQNLFTSGAVQNINYAATSYPAGGYMKFTSQQIVVQKGTSFTLSFTNSSNTKWARVIAWIDWNRDGIFDDATERIFYVGNAGSDNSATVLSISRTLSVPATATTGVIGMRIRLHDAWLPTAGPCGYQDNISSFDFFLKVL